MSWDINYQTNVITNNATHDHYTLQIESGDVDPGLRILLERVGNNDFYKADIQKDGTLRIFSSATDETPQTFRINSLAGIALKIEKKPKHALTDVFPNTLALIKFILKLGGKTSDARKVVDEATSESYALKSASKTGGVPHLLSEHRANKAYKVLGVPAAITRIYPNATLGSDGELHGVPDGTKMLSKFIEGRTLADYLDDPAIPDAKKQEIVNQARKGFIIDVLFANWDVVGPKLDNMMVGNDGVVYRIDNGGAFAYTGYGRTEDKGWGERPGELNYFLSPAFGDKTVNQLYTGKGPFAKFGPLTKEEMASQLKELLAFFDVKENSDRFFAVFEDAPADAANLKARLERLRLL